jgi:alpha-1,6-mannosyltransferase
MTARARLAIELGMLAALTVAAYLALWWAQRALWLNGLDPTAPPAYPRPGADVSAGTAQTGLVVLLGVGACALFAWLVVRAPRFAAAGLGPVAALIPAAVAVGLYLLPPTLSIDAYSYLSHGYLAATPGSNPYLQPSASVAAAPYGSALLAQGWQAVHPQTPYGPLWTAIERAAYLLSGGDVRLGILLIKLPALLAVLGTAVLIARFLKRSAPERRLRGTLLFLADPLVLIDLVGDGHNDALMACFLVLAIVAVARRWAALAILALTLAVLVKANALPFAVPLAVGLVAMRRSVGRLLLEAVPALVASAALTAALAAPYWAGLATLDGLRASGTPAPAWSVPGVLTGLLAPSATPAGPPLDAGNGDGAVLVQLLLIGLLVAATFAASVLARSVPGLIRGCGIVALVILLLLPLEWPWYATLPAAVLPLEAGGADVVAVLVLAAGSRLVAPIGDAASIGVVGPDWFTAQQALVGQTLPAAAGLALTIGRLARPAAHRP